MAVPAAAVGLDGAAAGGHAGAPAVMAWMLYSRLESRFCDGTGSSAVVPVHSVVLLAASHASEESPHVHAPGRSHAVARSQATWRAAAHARSPAVKKMQ